MSKTYELRVPACGRAAAERILRKLRFRAGKQVRAHGRIRQTAKRTGAPVPVAVKIMRERKSSRSSQKSQWKKESE